MISRGPNLFELNQIEVVTVGVAHEALGEGAMALEGHRRRATVAERGEFVGDAHRQRHLHRQAEVVEVVAAGQHDDVGLERGDAGPDIQHPLQHPLGLRLDAGRREQHMRGGEAADDLAHQVSVRRSR
jgi:hypothetical protein